MYIYILGIKEAQGAAIERIATPFTPAWIYTNLMALCASICIISDPKASIWETADAISPGAI